ncbi:flippase [Limosilactobacillus fermentum]|uniref:flippase n=1 Tax=Limosilactobacillus fermentum TaxID=1613 RepID=UPI002F261349
MKNSKSLSVNAFLNGIRNALNLVFPLITFPYVSRVLSVDGMGIYNFSSTYVNYFLLIAGLGISTYAVREGAKYRDNTERINTFASQIFTINIISTVVAYVLLLLSLVVFGSLHNYASAILIFSIQLVFTTIGTEWIYTIYEDFSYITIRSISFKIISIALLFIFVKTPSDYLWYASITVFASVGSNIFNYIHAKSFSCIKLVKQTDWQHHLKPTLIIFASSLAVTLYVSCDTTLLGLLKDEHAVGIYGVAVKIYSIVGGTLSAVLTVTIPRLALLYGKGKFEDYRKLLSKVFDTLSILVLPSSVGLIMLSKEVVLIIASAKYLDSTFSLQIITWAIIFSNFSWIFNQCVLIPAKRETKSLRNTLLTVGINIGLNFILIPVWSYNGTALSTVISEFLVMLMNGYSARDIVSKIIFTKESVNNFVTSIIGCVGIVAVCIICQSLISSIVMRVFLSVFMSLIIYVSALILLKNEIAIQSWEKIKQRL